MQTVHACVSVCVSVCLFVRVFGGLDDNCWDFSRPNWNSRRCESWRSVRRLQRSRAPSSSGRWTSFMSLVKDLFNGHDSLYVEHQSCTIWPFSDKDSPFYDLNATELSRWLLWFCICRWMEIKEGVGGNFLESMMTEVTRQRFEVVVVMEGTSETSNMTFQVFKSPPSQAS